MTKNLDEPEARESILEMLKNLNRRLKIVEERLEQYRPQPPKEKEYTKSAFEMLEELNNRITRDREYLIKYGTLPPE